MSSIDMTPFIEIISGEAPDRESKLATTQKAFDWIQERKKEWPDDKDLLVYEAFVTLVRDHWEKHNTPLPFEVMNEHMIRKITEIKGPKRRL
jgi:hypothetical protein